MNLDDQPGAAEAEAAVALLRDLVRAESVNPPGDVSGPARAAAAALAHRASGALAVSTGSASVRAGSVAERTAREALFLLVFGSRPAIREALLGRFGAAR